MIRAVFHKTGNYWSSVELSGHSGFSDAGTDIVCAAVSSAFMLTVNGITEVLGIPAAVNTAEDGWAKLSLPESYQKEAAPMMDALKLHLDALAESYQNNINVIISEV